MSDKPYIADHNDLPWVDKAGLTLLGLVLEDQELRLSLNDYLVIIKYIYRNGAKHLTGLRICLLNKFETEHPQHMGTMLDFEAFCDKIATISQKKALALAMNHILTLYKPHISEHIDWVKNQMLKHALEGLFTMATYVLENDIEKEAIPCPDLIRETLRLIEQKLPTSSTVNHNKEC